MESVFDKKQFDWIRIFLSAHDEESTLVYCDDTSTVADTIRDLNLYPQSKLTIWIKIENTEENYPLDLDASLLTIRDDFLHSLGYSDLTNITRLEIDNNLSNFMKFFVGPLTNGEVNESGYLYILKGLVVPQWHLKFATIIRNNIFIYSNLKDNTKPEVINLTNGLIKVRKTYSLKRRKYILQVTADKRTIFVGFNSLSDQSIWKHWLVKASKMEPCEEKLDLTAAGLRKIPSDIKLVWSNIKELVLSNNVIDSEDCSFKYLLDFPNLKKLTLSKMKLSRLPIYVTRLCQLEYLDLTENYLQSLPEEFRNLSSIVQLYLDNNNISNLSRFNDYFQKLRVLSVSHNHINNDFAIFSTINMKSPFINRKKTKDKRSKFDEQRDLSIVNLRGNYLKGVIRLADYGNLIELDVSENSIEQLDISQLDKLRCVKCSKNQLTNLVINGKSLISLIAGNNKLKKLNVSPEPTVLQHFDISFNELEKLPEWISRCNSLESLFASHNRLTELPEELFCNQFSSLSTLQLSFNQITVLPQIMHHVGLQQLFLQSNSITYLPRHFFIASSKLKVLNVSKNCLKELPQIFSINDTLERLYLSSNALTDISPLVNCTNLQCLHIAYNAINSLPNGCVSAWREMEELVISGNSLRYILEGIVNWNHLRVLRSHSNLLTSCPNFERSNSIKILDISHNEIEKLNLLKLVSKQMQYLDISGNTRLYVEPKDLQICRSERLVSLVDVSGKNRPTLPSIPIYQETENYGQRLPWTLGFTETTGQNERLYATQLRLHSFCNTDALLGIFDTKSCNEIPKKLVQSVPRILLQERSVNETTDEYMKYTMLTAYRELKEKCNRFDITATLCHICGQNDPSKKTGSQSYVLRIATIGDAKTILCRNSGSLTLTHAPCKNMNRKMNSTGIQSSLNPDPQVTQINLQDQDQFLLLANKNLWDVMSIEEAVAEVRSVFSPVLAAKRLQDLAQSYGCDDNLSILVLRFHELENERDLLMKELRLYHRKPNVTKCYVPLPYDCENISKQEPNESERSSPSGQSDKYGCVHMGQNGYTENVNTSSDSAVNKRYDDILVNENSRNKRYVSRYGGNGNSTDCGGSSLERPRYRMPEERFRSWEYLLEQNTQRIFDKELDTLSRNFIRKSVPSRPELWSHRAKSVSHLPDCSYPMPFLSRHFGSSRSYCNHNRYGLTRSSLNGGPNAAYFGSLQRIMPFHLEYDYSEIKERYDNTVDSLEVEGRMHKYWDVTTTEL